MKYKDYKLNELFETPKGPLDPRKPNWKQVGIYAAITIAATIVFGRIVGKAVENNAARLDKQNEILLAQLEVLIKEKSAEKKMNPGSNPTEKAEKESSINNNKNVKDEPSTENKKA